MRMMFSPFGEMARGCCFGVGCVIGLAAVALLVMVFLGFVNVDWLVGLVEGIIG